MLKVHKSSRSKGFSLLEVLVALAVIAAAAITLMSTLNTQVQISQRASQRTYANFVASNVFANVRMQPVLPSVGESNGAERSGPYNFRWLMRVQNTDQSGLLRLDITVSLAQADQPAVTILQRTEFAARP